MSYANKEMSYSLSYGRRYDQFSTAGDGGFGVGPMTTRLSSHKVYLIIYRHDEGFRISWSHCRAIILVSSWNRYYPVEFYYGSSFIFLVVAVKVVLVLVTSTSPPIKYHNI